MIHSHNTSWSYPSSSSRALDTMEEYSVSKRLFRMSLCETVMWNRVARHMTVTQELEGSM
jgi:hypothetical protein